MALPKIVVDTVEIPVGNLERAVAWYGAALEFQAEWSDQGHALLSRDGEKVRLLLVQTKDEARLGIRSCNANLLHGVLDFSTPDLDGLHAHLTGLKAKVDALGPPANEWAPRGFGFFDSEGNRLGASSAPPRS
jgi:catechol-2,3-dioxygenase